MKTELELNELILSITNKIRNEHPEAILYLDEMPLTVPYQENPEQVTTNLTTYYNSLVELQRKYDTQQSDHQIIKQIDNMPISEIKTMSTDSVFQNLVIEVNNCTLSYIDAGSGEIPLLFLHGFPFSKLMWIKQLENLKITNRVIALDIRGFGESTDETTPLSIDLFATDLLAFMDKLKISKANVCGLSMGGYVVLEAFKKAPERFSSLILCDTQCSADTAAVKENRQKTIDQIELHGAADFNEKFITNVFHPNTLNSKIDVVTSLRAAVFANSKHIITAGLNALANRTETCSILNTIMVPTLIICGLNDEVIPLSQSEFLHKNIQNSVLKIINTAGHVSNLEQPEEFNNFMADFLNSISK